MAQEPQHSDETQPDEPRKRRMRKSADEKWLFGVAGGIAEYLDIDPLLVRIIFVALCFGGGSGILIYIILAILMPGPDDLPGESTGPPGSAQQIVGGLIIVVGAVLLLANLGILSSFPWSITWPIALIAVGVFIIAYRSSRSSA